MSSAGIAECGGGSESGSGPTTLATVTKVTVATSISKAAGSTSVSASKGAIFAQTSVKPVPTTVTKPSTLSSVVAKSSSTAPASAPTSPASTPSSGNVIVSSPKGMSLDATFYYDIVSSPFPSLSEQFS